MKKCLISLFLLVFLAVSAFAAAPEKLSELVTNKVITASSGLFRVDMISPLIGYAVGPKGSFAKTTDGITWAPIDVPQVNYDGGTMVDIKDNEYAMLLDLSFTDENTGLICGMVYNTSATRWREFVFSYIDGEFTQIYPEVAGAKGVAAKAPAASAAAMAIELIDTGVDNKYNIILGLNSGSVLNLAPSSFIIYYAASVTKSNGFTPTKWNSATLEYVDPDTGDPTPFPTVNKGVFSLRFISKDVGFACVAGNSTNSFKGSILKTTDGGINWMASNFTGELDGKAFTHWNYMPFSSVYFTDENNGWATTLLNYYPMMKAMGVSVGSVSSAQDVSIKIGEVDYSPFYGYLYKTTDAGATWQKVASDGTQNLDKPFNLFDLAVKDGDIIVAGMNPRKYYEAKHGEVFGAKGTSGDIFISSDSGATFTSVGFEGIDDNQGITGLSSPPSPYDSYSLTGVGGTLGLPDYTPSSADIQAKAEVKEVFYGVLLTPSYAGTTKDKYVKRMGTKPWISVTNVNEAVLGESKTLTFTGTNYHTNAIATFTNAAAESMQSALSTNITFTPDRENSSDTQLTGTLNVGADAPSGNKDMTVNNPADALSSNSVTFTVAGGTPSITSLTPAVGRQSETLRVTIFGSNFGSGATASFGSGITVSSTNFISSSQLIATITINSSAAKGFRTIIVTNPDSKQGEFPDAFTIIARRPAISDVTPDSSSPERGATISVIGTDFDTAATTTQVILGKMTPPDFKIDATNVRVISSKTIQATLPPSPSAPVGYYNLEVVQDGVTTIATKAFLIETSGFGIMQSKTVVSYSASGEPVEESTFQIFYVLPENKTVKIVITDLKNLKPVYQADMDGREGYNVHDWSGDLTFGGKIGAGAYLIQFISNGKKIGEYKFLVTPHAGP